MRTVADTLLRLHADARERGLDDLARVYGDASIRCAMDRLAAQIEQDIADIVRQRGEAE